MNETMYFVMAYGYPWLDFDFHLLLFPTQRAALKASRERFGYNEKDVKVFPARKAELVAAA